MSAGLNRIRNAIAGADKALVITTPEVSAVRDADRIIGLLEANELEETYLIVNRIRMDMVKRGDMMSSDDVTEILAIDLIGIVPDDEHIVISTNQGEPLVGSDSLAGRAYMNIARRLIGEEIPFLNLNERNTIFATLFGKEIKSKSGFGRFSEEREPAVLQRQLKLVLVSDRAAANPGYEQIKNDIIAVIQSILKLT